MLWHDERLIAAETFVPHSFEYLKKTGNIPATATLENHARLQAQFEAVSDVAIFRITYLSDGLKITGVMLLPKDRRKAAHPLLIFNRGGSGNYGMLTAGFLMRLADYARAGYLVFASNYRGNDGSGGKDEFGGAEVNDVHALLALAHTHPAWDGKNAFMLGQSRGAMMTYLAIKQGAQLNAAATMAGPSYTEHPERRPRMITIYRTYIPQYDTQTEKVMEARAAVSWADALNTPLLLLHGDADDMVDVSHSLRLDAELTRLGKPHKTIIYPGDNHFLTHHRQEAAQAVMHWFDEHR